MRRDRIDFTMLLFIGLLLLNSLRSGGFSNPVDWLSDKLIIVPGIVVGIAFHEYAHALVAYKLGDNTPKLQGRVTINPLAHVDWLGLAALFFCGFGWGRPVEINPYNFKHRRRDELMVSLAGVVMNLVIAAIFTLILKLLTMGLGVYGTEQGLANIIWLIFYYTIQINFVLMLFNLIPVPPLDGFNILAEIFNFRQTEGYWKIYNYGMWILLALILFNITGIILAPCIEWLMNLVYLVIII